MEEKYTTWQAIEKPAFREKIKDSTEKMTENERKYLRFLLEYVKGRGAIQTDILQFLLDYPMTEQNQATAVLELLKENAGLAWICFIDEISKRDCEEETKECLYNEVIYAHRNVFPEELMEECLKNCKNAFELRVEEEKCWDRNEQENEKALMKQLTEVATVVEAVSKEVKMCEEAKEEIVEKINCSAGSMENAEQKQEIERLKKELAFYKSGIKQAEQKNADLQKEYMQERIKHKKLQTEFEEYKETAVQTEKENTAGNDRKLEQILEQIKTLKEDNRRIEQVLVHLSEQKMQLFEENRTEMKDRDVMQQKDISENGELQPEDILPEESRSYMQVEEPEWQSKEEQEEDEIGEKDKVGFIVKLVKKLKYKHFQKLDEKEKITELCRMVDDRNFNGTQKKDFMDVFIRQTDYDRIYKLFESGKEAELIAGAE